MHLQSAFQGELPGCEINGAEIGTFSDDHVHDDTKKTVSEESP
jgi:hypothetical protein